ncbi:MAG: hypothetical protein ABL958_08415 [Bdellovibrionia bacterium]
MAALLFNLAVRKIEKGTQSQFTCASNLDNVIRAHCVKVPALAVSVKAAREELAKIWTNTNCAKNVVFNATLSRSG